jgi:hypothetical protein
MSKVTKQESPVFRQGMFNKNKFSCNCGKGSVTIIEHGFRAVNVNCQVVDEHYSYMCSICGAAIVSLEKLAETIESVQKK